MVLLFLNYFALIFVKYFLILQSVFYSSDYYFAIYIINSIKELQYFFTMNGNLLDGLLDEVDDIEQQITYNDLKYKGITIYGLPSDLSHIFDSNGNIEDSKSFLLLLSYFLSKAKLKCYFVDSDFTIIHKTFEDKQAGSMMFYHQKNSDNEEKIQFILNPNLNETNLNLPFFLNSFPKTIFTQEKMHIKDFLKQIGQLTNIKTLASEYQIINASEQKKKILSDLENAILYEMNQKLNFLKNEKQFLNKMNKQLEKIPTLKNAKTPYTDLLKQLAENDEEIDKNGHPLQILQEHQYFQTKWEAKYSNKLTNKERQIEKMNELKGNKLWRKLSPAAQKKILDYFKEKKISLIEELRLFDQQSLRSNEWRQWMVLELIKHYEKKVKGNGQIYKKEYEKTKNHQGILSDYPMQVAKLTRITSILQDFKKGQTTYKQFKDFCSNLGLPYEKLQSYFIKQTSQKTKEFQNHNLIKFNKVHVKPLEKTIAYKTMPSIKDPNERPLEEILEEIELYSAQPIQLEQLKRSFQQINKSFQQIKHWTSKEVRKWADSMRVSPEASLQKIISILDKANELSTEGHRLRDTQKLAILLFNNHAKSGSIGQIKTGEGKTTIVAILSAILTFKKMKVDVLTNNSVLAEEFIHQKSLFFKILGISASHNIFKSDGLKNCYNCDIVAGTITSFQFDYLRHNFEKENVMGDRKPQDSWVILDEVDSLVIDQGGNIAKLSSPFAGMQSLRYIYLNIWEELDKVEKSIEQQFTKKLQSIIEDIKNKGDEGQQELQAAQKVYSNEFEQKLKERMKINKKSIIQIKTIPNQLQNFIDKNFEKWVQNAFRAKYIFTKDKQYKVTKKSEDGELEIIPIDNQNTGVSMKNTILSNGIHQFLQLKHKLFLTYENLTSSFISNASYISKYKGKIFGLTGTLGSEAERSLLSYIYGVDFFSVPTYKEKNFLFYGGRIVEDHQFLSKTAITCLAEAVKIKDDYIQSHRSVLLICETIFDAQLMRQAIQKEIKKSGLEKYTKIKVYTVEQHAEITQQELQPGQIVIATNISGRGTDYKTSKQLNINGGIHVMITFMPCNKRVEDQALGRTARQGKNGTGQIIINKKKLSSEYALETESFYEAIEHRDALEQIRVNDMKNGKYAEIQFKDKLFTQFCKLYSTIKTNKKDIKSIYSSRDLKERWAFWIEQRSYSYPHIMELSVDEQFNKFLLQAAENIKGNINFNIYNSICLTDKLILDRNFSKAQQEFDNACKFKNIQYCYPLYMKKFEFDIESGDQLFERFKKGLGNLFFIPCQKNEKYKQLATQSLDKALVGINYEFDYFQQKILTKNEKGELSVKEIFAAENDQENFLVKHLLGRYTCLYTFKENIVSLKKQLKQELKDGIIISSKVPRGLTKFDSHDQNQKVMQDNITSYQANQFQFNGIGCVTLLSEVHDVNSTIIQSSRIQIGAGLTALVLCIPFPFLLPINGQIAGVLISEGITDIVMALVQNGFQEFNGWDYAKSKIISYAVSIITLGIKAALQSVKVLKKASDLCRRLAASLRNATRFQRQCGWIATKLEKLATAIDIMITKIQIQNAIKVGKEVSKQILKFKEAGKYRQFIDLTDIMLKTEEIMSKSTCQLVKSTFTNIIKNTAISIFISVCSQKALSCTVYSLINSFRKNISQYVQKNISVIFQAKKQQLSHYKEQKLFQKIIEESKDSIHKQIFKSLLNQFASSSWKIQAIKVALQLSLQSVSFYNFCQDKVDNYVKRVDDKIGFNKDKNSDEVMSRVLKSLVGYISNLLIQKIYKISSKFITQTVTISIKAIQQQRQREKKQKQIQQIKIREQFIKQIDQQQKQFKCVHEEIGNMFGVDSQEITDGTGISPLFGANIQDVKNIFKKAGVENVSDHMCGHEKELLNHMAQMNCDRGMVCLENKEGKIGHAQSVFKGKDNILRVGKPDGMPLSEYINNNKFQKDFKAVLGKNVNQDHIENIQNRIARNRIIMARDLRFEFVGLHNNQRFGMKKKKEKVKIQEIQQSQKFLSSVNQKQKKQFDQKFKENSKHLKLSQKYKKSKNDQNFLQLKKKDQKFKIRLQDDDFSNKLARTRVDYFPSLSDPLKFDDPNINASAHHIVSSEDMIAGLKDYFINNSPSTIQNTVNTLLAQNPVMKAKYFQSLERDRNKPMIYSLYNALLTDPQNLRYGPPHTLRKNDPQKLKSKLGHSIDLELIPDGPAKLEFQKKIKQKSLTIFQKLSQVHKLNDYQKKAQWENGKDGWILRHK